jgi:hypothetical protein
MNSGVQWCGSVMFIPNPDFFSSDLEPKTKKKGEGKIFCVLSFFVVVNFTKIYFITVLNGYSKKI